MTLYYKATFSDGTSVRRMSKSNRTYTHAWKWIGGHSFTGFCSSERNALNELNKRKRWYRAADADALALIAPAVVITHREYEHG